MSHPVVILTCMRSFSSLVSGMLGQHPCLFALPEINPFLRDTVGETIDVIRSARPRSLDGMLRLIAELEFEQQTDQTIGEAAKWLLHRQDWNPRELLDYVAESIAPRGWVEKSPSTVVTKHGLELMHKYCPDVCYLHLTRHPQQACRSIDKITNDTTSMRQARRSKDAESSWFDANRKILDFCANIPPGQYMLVRGEDILQDPERYLGQICEWLELDFSTEIFELMIKPENSPFACIGPPSAPFGNDPGFLRAPTYKRKEMAHESLDQPLDWTAPQRCFSTETIALARQLGYS